MARAAANARGKSSRTFQLSEQFQLVRISAAEYKLVSLFDALSVKAKPELGGLLDRVLPALHRGTDRESIVAGTTKRESAAVRVMLRDFVSRGLVESSSNGERHASNPAKVTRYAKQRQFFSNFQSVDDMSRGPSAKLNGSEHLQRRLTDCTVMVVGLGRVGSRVAHALASAGVGTIVGGDSGIVAESDLADSTFVTGDVGRPRGQALAEHIAAVNPLVNFATFEGPVFAANGAQLPEQLSMVALCEDSFDPLHHAAINRACLDKNVTWIGYRSYRTRLEIGPTVVPRETACFHCYELRRSSNSSDFAQELELQQRLAATESELGGLNITLGADLLALEMVKTLSHFAAAATYGSVYVMDLVSLETRTRPLLKIPRCPECGTSASRPLANVWRYDLEGGAG